MKDLTYKERVLKEFEEQFPNIGIDDRDFTGQIEKDQLKAFISQALDGHAEELREKVHGLRVPNKGPASIGFNNALACVLLTLIPSPSPHE